MIHIDLKGCSESEDPVAGRGENRDGGRNSYRGFRAFEDHSKREKKEMEGVTWLTER